MKILIAALALLLLGPATAKGGAMELSSPAFQDQQSIPTAYTCDGADISPALSISGVPPGTASLALLMDDPDAPVGDWVHWIVFNLPPGVKEIPEDVPAAPELSDGAVQGANSWRRIGYGGPCPPDGAHRYFFKLYALDAKLDLNPGASKKQLLEAMQGRVLEETVLMGTYQRR
jgi:hypothetical protein